MCLILIGVLVQLNRGIDPFQVELHRSCDFIQGADEVRARFVQLSEKVDELGVDELGPVLLDVVVQVACRKDQLVVKQVQGSPPPRSLIECSYAWWRGSSSKSVRIRTI